MKLKLLSIVGPTASGKTKFSLKIANKFNGEIVNSDSLLLYKYLNIGTAKPKKDKGEKAYVVDGIKHHLIDLLEPDQEFSVADFQKLARSKIEEIQLSNKLPILVGGSPLYSDSVLYNYQFPDSEKNNKFRQELSRKTPEELILLIKENWPTQIKSLDLNNKRRLIRLIELLSQNNILTKRKHKLSSDYLIIGVKTDKELLYQNINKRVGQMFSRGLEKEVKKLFSKYKSSCPAFMAIGYRQFKSYFENEISKDDLRELIKRDTRRFAKRQMTWFKKDKNIQWLASTKEAEKMINRFNKS